MKRTSITMSRLLSGLSTGLFFCLMLLFVGVNQTKAQSLSPLPTFKSRTETQSTVKQQLLELKAKIEAYGNNRPQNDPQYLYLMMLWDSYNLIDELLLNPDMNVESAVGSTYPLTQKTKGTHSAVNLDGFYTQNWPPAFVEIVDKLKL